MCFGCHPYTLFLCICTTAKESNELVVYAYDAFCGDWGPGPAIVEELENSMASK
jgi:thiamine transport system substrate-binding protein